MAVKFQKEIYMAITVMLKICYIFILKANIGIFYRKRNLY